MNVQSQPNEILDFFKTIANEERLKIVGALVNQKLTMTDLASRTNMPPTTVLHHLENLIEMGLVKVENLKYRLDTDVVETLARQVLSQQRRRVTADDFADSAGEAYDRKVLSDYFTPEGALKALPTQHKKLMVVLRYLVKNFELGVHYPEKQVNEIIRRFHEDTAALRRYMVDNGLMEREHGEYWRVES
jgi:hypothetical protein